MKESTPTDATTATTIERTERTNPHSGVTYIKSVDHSNGVNTISFKLNTHYEFLFNESQFIGLSVETSTEHKTYYVSGEDEEKLTDEILKPALKAFAELDFEFFDTYAVLFFWNYLHLTQEILNEKIERLQKSTIFQCMNES